jgi:signal transduction histidine kinase/FixJ family two-component response regulator
MGVGLDCKRSFARHGIRLSGVVRQLACVAAAACVSGAAEANEGESPTLRVGAYDGYMSMLDYIDHAGARHGVNAGVLRSLAGARGAALAYRALPSVDEAWRALEAGEIDIAPVACEDPVPRGVGVLSEPYATVRVGVVYPRGRRAPRALSDLAGQRVVVAGGSLGAATLKSKLHGLHVRDVLEMRERQAALEFVATGRADAFVGIHPLNIDAVGALALGTLASAAVSQSVELCLASRRDGLPLTIMLGYDKRAVIGFASAAAVIALAVIVTLAWAYRRTQAARAAAVSARSEAIAAREQALAADRAKSAFVAMMSHEIRTPMNAVVGVLDLLDTMSLAQEPRRYLGIAQHSARLMLRVVDDTLDYLKIEQDALTLDAAPFDICALAAAAVELHAPLAARKGLALYLATMPHFDRQLIGDEARINQIVTNLLSNAIRFTERGHVLLALRRKTVRGRAWLILSVADTGAGISEAYRSRLFSPFTQQDSTTTRRYGGTGLGLSIVKRLVDLMEGTIDVRSKIGEGTCVRVRLPIRWGGERRVWPQAGPARATLTVPLPAMSVATRALLQKMGVRCVAPGRRADIDVSVDATGALVVAARNGSQRVVRAIDDFAGAVAAGLLRADVSREARLGGSGGAQHHSIPAADARAAPFAREGVLVVEDNEVNRDIIVRQLQALGVHAEEAADGVEGYASWERTRPALVFLDCHMPGMDGYTLARHIRRAEAQSRSEAKADGEPRTILVAISANATQDDVRTCRQAGVDDYLAKPITRLKLAALLEKWAETANADTQSAHR